MNRNFTLFVLMAIWGLASSVGCGQDQTPANPKKEEAKARTVRVEVLKPKNVTRLIYQIDGVPIGSSDIAPYSITLDPAQIHVMIPGLASGDHILSVTVEDKSGVRKIQPDTVVLAFEKGLLGRGDGTGGDGDGMATPDTKPSAGGTPPTEINIPLLCQSLAGLISQKSGYSFQPDFADQIRIKTTEYRFNTIDDAQRYRRDINKSFRDRGLPLLLGYVVAMSQSKFHEGTTSGPGIWRIPPKIAMTYAAQGETEAIMSDSKRSSEIAAAYIKDLTNVFGLDDFMYAIACYGMPLNDAGTIRSRLEAAAPDPAARNDFWGMVKTGIIPAEGAERVVRFFAAGIVAENPDKFGLQSPPLSSLY